MKSAFTWAVFMLLIGFNTASAERKTLYYILDSSGSMWGRVDGKIKSEIAKDTLTSLLLSMPDGLDSGLTVYGHRRKGDCSDIEEVIPVGALDKAAAIKKISLLKPKGKTPLADSVMQTAERLKSRESESTVVLVSDGIETCGKDPCEVVRKLKESGIKFVMHVVGFNVSGETTAQLKCMAEASGGRYFGADNATQLLSALSTVQESVAEQKALPEPTPTPTVKMIEQHVSSASRSIKIKAIRPGKVRLVLESWVKRPYYWKLVDPETGREKASFSSLDTQLVPAGTYQLLWRQVEHGSDEVVLGEVFTVNAGETVEVPLKTALRLNTPAWAKPPYYWQLKDPDDSKVVAAFYRRLEAELVPPGRYELIWREVEHGSREVNLGVIEVKPDILNTVDLDTAFKLVPADWVYKKPYYWHLVDKSNTKHRFEFSGEFRPEIIPPGYYSVRVRLIEHGTWESNLGDFEVEKGKLNEFPINTGVKLIPPEGLEPPYKCTFIALDENGKEKGIAGQFGGRWIGIPLAPGKYRILYHQKEYGSKEITLVNSFDLRGGVLAEIDL